MCCDYRVMIKAERFKIGLNETRIGLVAPVWYATACGLRKWYLLSLLLLLFSLS